MLIFIPAFLIALFVTILATPIVSKIAVRFGAVDNPGERKVHTKIVPRLGGAAIYAGFICSLIFGIIFLKLLGRGMEPLHLLGIIIGGTLIFLVGIFDDLTGLKPITKLIWQFIAAGFVVFSGVTIGFISNPFNGMLTLGLVGIPLTLIWIVGMTNAINLIDGLDGLAAGVTAISSGTLFFVALRTHQIGAALIMLSLCGAALGFLRYNFFPAKIFLGDSGSYLLGFLLASASVIGVFKTTLVVALIIPIMILGVPIFDTMFAITRRLGEGRSPFAADKKHIHHMLLRAGFTQREAVLAIYIACFLLSIGALLMALSK
ncbi:MAG: UDP-N-acetylglucosamine:undecaprenyl-P N-acetylglucosaminyl 1-P transferase [Candidatus Saganbacteria bacterium]|uniref:UDP-N-acetylglucosamine:undecaprenyl-P N-acetylglucosaminyl 1-P transferase n=1 Tax=Candidatus Saganbacteria bacterium TaxID=2575572 RepID=A0A833NXL6_UNCSA|nr:MAG: UDP-N-acetylglucosamine:undecaprenyl-P N-acetylglucosaminyl 1-P transferase [Candidatus Saganbacteria bacterium]